MKIACLVFVLTGLGLVGSSRAYASPLAHQQTSETPTGAGRTHVRDAEHSGQANIEKRQKVGLPSHDPRNHHQASGKSHSRNRAALVKTNRPQQLRNTRKRSTSTNVMNVQQPRSGSPAGGSARIANNRPLPVHTTAVAALDGRQVKFSNRGSTSASIGGPARTPRNTGVINGTSINRKHLN